MITIKLRTPVVIKEIAIEKVGYETDLLVLAKEQLEFDGKLDISKLASALNRDLDWVIEVVTKLSKLDLFSGMEAFTIPKVQATAKPEKKEDKNEKRVNKCYISSLIREPYGDDIDLELEETWVAFVDMRVAARKPMTPYGARLIIKKLLAWDTETAKRALQNSIMNNWTGVFEPRPDLNKKDTLDDEINRAIARVEGRL